jgi:hypothetical protein
MKPVMMMRELIAKRWLVLCGLAVRSSRRSCVEVVAVGAA